MWLLTMNKPTINNIFTTPVYETEIDREFTKQELNFVSSILGFICW